MAVESVGTVGLDLVLQSDNFNKQLNDKVKGLGSNMTSKLTKSLSKVGGLVASAFAVKKIVDFGAACIKVGSDLSEVQNVVDVTFGSMSGRINEFANNAIEDFGLSELSAKKYSSTIGAMFKSMGLSSDQAVNMSETITALTGDMASFYNLNSEEAFNKIRSGISGETEPLKQLGINMSVANLEAYALSKGIGTSYNKMSEGNKAILRYNYLLEVSKDAQGDFSRNSESWANQTKVLSERFNSLKATLGQGLINVLTPLLPIINNLISKVAELATAFSNLTIKAFGSGKESNISDSVKQIYDNAGQASSKVEEIGDSAVKAAKKASKSVFGFDELNVLQDNSSENTPAESADTGISDLMSGAANATEQLSGESSRLSILLDDMIKKTKKLMKLFKDKFKIGLDETGFNKSLNNVKTDIKNIGQDFLSIFSDGKVLGAFDNLFTTIIGSLGTISGNIIGLGTSIISGLVSSISKYLDENQDFVKTKLTEFFNIGEQLVVSITELTTILSSIFSNIFNSEAFSNLGSTLLSIIINPFIETKVLLLKVFRDITDGINLILSENKENIEYIFISLLELLDGILSPIKDLINNTFKTIQDVYDEYVSPAIGNISKGFSDLFDFITEKYKEYIEPFIEDFVEKWEEACENHIQPAIDRIVEFVGKLIKVISEIWKDYLVPFIEWIVDSILPVIMPILEGIKDGFFAVVDVIVKTVNNIIDTLEGLLDFVVGVFKGDWEKAWNGIKEFFIGLWNTLNDFFEGIWDAIVDIVVVALKAIWDILVKVNDMIETAIDKVWNGIKNFFAEIWKDIKDGISNRVNEIKDNIVNTFTNVKDGVVNLFTGMKDKIVGIFSSIGNALKTPLNSVIGLVNNAIGGINGISVDIPDWIPGVGGKHIGFNIPDIPMLANGGVLTQPTLNIAGEYAGARSNPEIVSPKSIMQEVVDTGSRETNELLKILIEVLKDKDMSAYVNLDGRTIYEKIQNTSSSEARRTNKPQMR